MARPPEIQPPLALVGLKPGNRIVTVAWCRALCRAGGACVSSSRRRACRARVLTCRRCARAGHAVPGADVTPGAGAGAGAAPGASLPGRHRVPRATPCRQPDCQQPMQAGDDAGRQEPDDAGRCSPTTPPGASGAPVPQPATGQVNTSIRKRAAPRLAQRDQLPDTRPNIATGSRYAPRSTGSRADTRPDPTIPRYAGAKKRGRTSPRA